MKNDYIITLDGHNLIREIELRQDDTRLRVGTDKQCEIRFRRDLFFDAFDLEFNYAEDGVWEATCSDKVYFSSDGGVGKARFKRLSHGDEFAVRYADSGAMVFAVRFAIDFEKEQGSYDRWIDLSERGSLSLGGKPNCDLYLRGFYVTDDFVTIQRNSSGYELVERGSRYGLLCDGDPVTGSVLLKNMSFFSLANYSFYFKDERLYFSKTADIMFNGVAYEDERLQCITSEYPRFNRNTRLKTVIAEGTIPVLDPPNKEQKPKTNVVVQLLPAVGMLAVIVLLRGTMGNSAGSAFIWISAASMGVGVLASVLGIISERKRYKKDLAEREEKYTAYIDQKREQVEEERTRELDALNARYYSARDELDMVAEFSGKLFDRRPGDEDFLHLLLGQGARKSARQVDYKKRETLDTDELAALPSGLHNDYEKLSSAPIAIDLDASNAIGIVGPHSKRMAFMRNALVDIATRHYESDVKLFVLVSESNADLVRWARLLPHLKNEDLNCWNMVCDDESRNVLFEYLYKALTTRSESGGKITLPRIVLLVLDDCGLKNHPLSQFVDIANDLGVTFVFFEHVKEYLPLGCDWLVTLDAKKFTGTVVSAADAKDERSFEYDPLTEEQSETIVNKLAPVYCEEVSLEGSLTKSISLFELLDIIAAEDLDLKSRWASTSVDKSLAVPLGVTKSKTVSLDLHDKAHGPHGLVAGTTGSGKSEVLQTYILSIATYFHPYEVSFLIIDFKGGGMVNQFRDLPHLAGAITNIDGREIDRSLKSIKAELQKRQRYFADADVNHISNYIRKYKAGEVAEPLPHLIIIVDEFAELKAEQPEFMKELISASRIGRSLGVHLILATQKPAGQVSEQIWSNSRFKLCLKVQSKEDSNEVIKSPLAAEIKEPGRAYLQVGNNEIFELFQSGFSSAPEQESDDNTREFSIFELSGYGKRVPVYERKRKRTDGVSATQLDAIVSHVARFCEAEGIEQLPSICLPPLPDVVDFPQQASWRDGRLALGVYDDPDSQYQGAAYFDVDSANVLLIGSSQTGKTNFLQALVRGVAQERSPEQAVLYIMDFASMTLKNFERLNHVGGVVLPGEDEKVRNLFKLLGGELATRKRRMLEVGVSSFSAYVEAGYTDLPHVYVLIDNFAVFKELYADAYEDDFITLCRDGLAYGISAVVANSVTSGIGYRHFANFSAHIALTCNDSSEYSTLFDHCRMAPKNVPGRALCAFNKELYEFQVYLAFAGEREIDRVRAMVSFADSCNARYGGKRARLIPSVPDVLDFRYLKSNYTFGANEMAFALSYSTVEPIRINLDSAFSLAIVGKDAKVRLGVMRALLQEVHEGIFDRPVELFVIDGIMRELHEFERMPYVHSYSSTASDVSLVIEGLHERLRDRYQRVAVEGYSGLAGEPYLVAIINSPEAVEYVSESSGLMDMYNDMAKQFAAMRVLFVFGDLGDTTVSYSSPALLKGIKEERHAFVASNALDVKFFDLPTGATRAYRAPLESGQVFYINGSDIEKAKVATWQPGE